MAIDSVPALRYATASQEILMVVQPELQNFSTVAGDADLIHADAFDWLAAAEPASIHAVVTDPPYGLVEYQSDQLDKRKNGSGGRLAHPAEL